MRRKMFIIICTIFLTILLSIDISAKSEIDEYGVNLDLALDYFNPKSVRTSEYKITDSGRFKQGYDSIRFNDLYDGQYDLDRLYSDGYRTLVVEIELEMKEVDKGYQHIFIYDDTSDTTWITGCKYSLGGSTKVTSYTNVTFYFESNLANIHNNEFVIRYGVSGDFDDSWKNQNVKIYVGVSKETQKTQNMWELKWDNDEHTRYTATMLPLSK